MSSMDYNRVKMDWKPYYPQHQHALSANNVPTYASRAVPSYHVGSEDNTYRGCKLSSPRYSPSVQPWRRQQAQSSLSFVPSTSPRMDQVEYTTAQPKRPVDRAPVCVSPFRSVRRMKQPFQLRLPSSPSMESLQATPKERQASRSPSSKNHALRTWRSDQNLTTSSMETFGLLPSPPLSDAIPPRSPSSAYFSPQPGSESDYSQYTPKSCSHEPAIKPCEVVKPSTPDIQMEPPKTTTGSTNVHMAHSNLVQQCESGDGSLPRTSTDTERMSSPAGFANSESFGTRDFSWSSEATQRSRSGTVSSEGSWVPSSLSHFETWLQRAPVEMTEVRGEGPKECNRRKFQIVQQSPPQPRPKSKSPIPDERKVPDAPSVPDEPNVADEPVIFARKTKPKLVDISRQSSPPMSYPIPAPPARTIPSTPDQRQREVSAFSPDTPLEMSDSGYNTHASCYSPEEYRDEKEDDDYTDASSLNSESASATVVGEKPPEPQEQPRSPPNPSIPPRTQPLPKPHASPQRSSHLSEKEELGKWWDHEWTIDQLEHSVKDFPRNMLRLTSPVVMFIRHNNEKALIRPFRDIFPEVAENLLDGLCASLIARNHVVSLASGNKRSDFSQRPNLPRLDTVPERISPSSTMQFSQPVPSRIKDRVLGSRGTELRKELDRIIDNLLFAITGREQDETLKASVLALAQVLESKV